MARPKGKTLALDDVLTAAHAVVEREGFAALTLANVARQLGIQPPSLCHHVRTTEALRLRLAENGWLELAEQLQQVAGASEPRGRLLDYARATRRFALAHPRAFELMIHARLPHAQVVSSPLLPKLLLPLFEGFRELGLSGTRRLHATRALRSAVTGFLLLEIAGQFQMQGSVPQSFDQMVGALVDGFASASGQAPRRTRS